MMVQELQERDWHERQAACERMLANVPPGRLLCSDEAHFHLSGFVNKQNFRYWAEANPRQHHEQPLHSQWVTVWCAVADFGNTELHVACERMLANVPPGRVLCSDEAHFHLWGFVNKQNFRYWAEENPRQHHERPLHSKWVTVWCAVADFGIIGPYFFLRQKDALWQIILTAILRCYGTFYCPGSVNMELELCGFNKMELQLIRQEFLWHFWDNCFQDVSSHYMVTFLGQLVHQTCLLAISFFFFLGHLKSEVFRGNPQMIEALKDAIHNATAAIPPEMTHGAMRSFTLRLQQYIAREGKHLEDIIFKTHWKCECISINKWQT